MAALLVDRVLEDSNEKVEGGDFARRGLDLNDDCRNPLFSQLQQTPAIHGG